MLDPLDPLAVDRAIARAARAWRAWRRRLRQGHGVDEDPFALDRAVTGRTAYEAVARLPEWDPLRQPLQRWIHRLLEQRVDRDALLLCEFARRGELHVVDAPEYTRASLAELLARALDDAPRRAAWLAAFVARAGTLAAREAELCERRQEIAHRLGLDSPDAIELPSSSVADSARGFITATDDMATDFKRAELAAFVDLSLGAEASEGWPARLAPRTLLDLLHGSPLLDRVQLDPGTLPRAVAPASFLRALARLGAAWEDALAPANQPFVIAFDPYGLRRRTTGALLAGLPLSPAFLGRQLSLGKQQVRDHGRVLARVALLATRAAALRVILRAPALAGHKAFTEAFEQGAHETFGLSLDGGLAGALFRLHRDDGQRFAGILLAAARNQALRGEHDEDWYRNPRAVDQLRSEAALSPVTTCTSEALDAGATALSARLLEALA